MITGLFVLLLAGLCQGSFGLGFKKYDPFSWEAFYFICSVLFGMIPAAWMFLQVPDFMSYYEHATGTMLWIPVLCGAFWGITSIGFSKGVDYIGMSLVYGLSMGLSAVVGSLTPMAVNHTYLEGTQMICLVIGIVVTLAGIGIITKAGLVKESETNSSSSDRKNGKMKIGICLALFSGLGSGAMNVGFDYTSSLTGNLTYIQASALKWIPVLMGGSIASAIWCMLLMWKQKSWHTLTEKGAGKEYLKLLVTCTVWFTALAAYGTASSMLGAMGPAAGWILFNALALLISNGWGVKTGEWKGTAAAKKWLLAGNAVLILSWIFVGLSNR